MAPLLLIALGVVLYMLSHRTDDKMKAVVRFVAGAALIVAGVAVYFIQLIEVVVL